MEDDKIVELYLSRSAEAIAQTVQKYGSRLRNIAYNILNDRERVTYSTPSSDQNVEDILEGFTVFVMNYRPNVEKDIYTVDDILEAVLDGSTFHLSIDDVYVGFSDVDLTWEELQIVLKSLKKEIEVEEAGEAEIIDNDNSGDAPAMKILIQKQEIILKRFLICKTG